ncbi:MAG: flagellar hook basal-body protein [Acetobacteraceae bacterium]|nr:flagellar hook basal-body protein [Acetobacteraceae bacterium]
MDSPGYILLSRMTAQLRAQAVTAHNLANAETPGFRQSRPVFAAHVEAQGSGVAPQQRRAAFAWDRATWRDAQPGPVTRTGNPLDVAISGEGFFVVETPRGDRYTRAGRFALGPDGRIVDAQGHPVLGDQGRPLAVSPGDTRLEVMGDGTLRSENGVIGRFRVVRFEDGQALRAEGDRLLAAGAEPLPVERPAVVQGAVEGSNVQPILEMTRMMGELREFQMAAQFAEREAERQQSAIDRILRRRN